MQFKPLEHQAAGHGGVLESEDGVLFLKQTNQQEIDFYTKMHEIKLNEDTEDTELGSRLFHWIPDYMGILEPGISSQIERKEKVDSSLKLQAEEQSKKLPALKEQKFIALRNCLHGFKQPSIMDIKLGKILTDENATLEKQERLKKVSESTTSGSLSFRICGMKIPRVDMPKDQIEGIEFEKCIKIEEKEDKKYLIFDKFFGRSLTDKTVDKGLRLFFRENNLPKSMQDLLIEKMLVRLQILYNCLLEEEVRIVSGSLLFVYENDLSRWNSDEDPLIYEQLINESDDEDDESESSNIETPLSLLQMIDFAHSKFAPGKGHDENLIAGIENLIGIFENL